MSSRTRSSAPCSSPRGTTSRRRSARLSARGGGAGRRLRASRRTARWPRSSAWRSCRRWSARNWNKQEAAAQLGLYRPTLYSKMRKHEIRDEGRGPASPDGRRTAEMPVRRPRAARAGRRACVISSAVLIGLVGRRGRRRRRRISLSHRVGSAAFARTPRAAYRASWPSAPTRLARAPPHPAGRRRESAHAAAGGGPSFRRGRVERPGCPRSAAHTCSDGVGSVVRWPRGPGASPRCRSAPRGAVIVSIYHSDDLTYAASIAYYALLSLFPFLLLLISLLGIVTSRADARAATLDFVLRYFPTRLDFVASQLQALQRTRVSAWPGRRLRPRCGPPLGFFSADQHRGQLRLEGREAAELSETQAASPS